MTDETDAVEAAWKVATERPYAWELWERYGDAREQRGREAARCGERLVGDVACDRPLRHHGVHAGESPAGTATGSWPSATANRVASLEARLVALQAERDRLKAALKKAAGIYGNSPIRSQDIGRRMYAAIKAALDATGGEG